MDRFKQQCAEIVGVSTSGSFKISLLGTDENIDLVEHC
jgi:hypothetical protein